MIKTFTFISIGLHVLSMVAAFGMLESDSLTIASIAFGMFWILSTARQWDFPSSLFLVVVFLLVIAGFFSETNKIWLVFSYMAGIIAWDLSCFQQTLLNCDRVIFKDFLIKRHLFQLFSLAGTGVIIMLLALQVEVTLTLFPIILLICVLLLFSIKR